MGYEKVTPVDDLKRKSINCPVVYRENEMNTEMTIQKQKGLKKGLGHISWNDTYWYQKGRLGSKEFS